MVHLCHASRYGTGPNATSPISDLAAGIRLTSMLGGNMSAMVKLAATLVACTMALTALQAQQSSLESRMSPKLHQFMKDHPAASASLQSSFSEVFSNRTVWVFYFYTGDDSEARAFHFYPNTVGLPEVTICVCENQQPADQFITMLFEVLNARGEKRFNELADEARARSIPKAEFVREVLRQEFEATKRTRDLVLAIKFSRKEKSASHYYRLFAECPTTFDDFLSYTKRVSGKRDAMKEYEAKYDSLRQEKD
jgi:hypothetical protein